MTPSPGSPYRRALDEASFRQLVENAPDAIVVSRDGVVLYANAAAARLLGHDDVSGLVGKPMTFLDRQAVEVMRRRIAQMAETGERLIPREYTARRVDGREITAEIASTILDLEGRPAVLAYVRDVTDRARLRAQLAHADRLASLGLMAAGVAHEINNPLSSMSLATELLSRQVGPDHGPLVAEVRAGLDRVAAIVRDLRFFGRDEEEAPGPMDLRAAIDAAERLVQHEIRHRGSLAKELDELPPVLGVPRRIEQVFVNLLLNAAYALGDEGDGRIVLRSHATTDHVMVTVEDDGRGIPSDMLDLIFEPFFTTRAGSGGTGLGLSICRDIVVRSGGDLVAKSAVGEGTTMEVTLARYKGDGARREVPAPPPLPAELRPGGTRRRVLVVDDEPVIVRMLSRSLASHADVTGESDPARALALILQDGARLDVIVCDVMMPGMTGIDLHERVARERPDLAGRFLFMTGGTYTARTRDYLARVPNPCLGKPFDLAQVLAAIEQVAGGAGTA